MKLELRFLDQDGIKHCPNLICNSCLLWICHSLYQWALFFMWGRKDNMLMRQRGLKTMLLWYSPHILETNALPVLILEYRSIPYLSPSSKLHDSHIHSVTHLPSPVSVSLAPVPPSCCWLCVSLNTFTHDSNPYSVLHHFLEQNQIP